MRDKINDLKTKLEKDKMLNRLSDLNKYLARFPNDKEAIDERNGLIHSIDEIKNLMVETL